MSNNAMSNETDLDWLARNVHVWPCGKHQPWCYVVTKIDGERTWASNVLSSIFPYSLVDKGQWLARRAELQNKPSWKDAPAQATCMAQEPRGVWTFFACQPSSSSPVHDTWWRLDGFQAWSSHMRGEVLGDWRDTLEKRPEEFKPFTSIEDNQDQVLTQQQDNGWFERVELPPVGKVCEWLECNKTGWQEVIVAGYYMNAAWIVPKGKEPITVFNPTGFRPIRTERDVLIEIIKNTDDTDDKIADAILAAGFKRGGAA